MEDYAAKTALHIVQSIEASLAFHEHYKDSIPPNYYGNKKFRSQCQTIKLAFPRRFGHTTAAMHILEKYPHSVCIVADEYWRSHVGRRATELNVEEQIIPLHEFRTSVHDLTMMRTLATIRKELDFVLVDDTKITEEDIDKIFHLYNPRVLVLLGTLSC